MGLALCIFSVLSQVAMDEVVKTFLESPSEQLLDECSRDQLLKLVDHFKVEVDASYVGAGAVLLQPDDLDVKPVCFFLRKFNKHQLNYSVIEKETLALILALQHFSVYVSAGPVVVFTDHNPLTFLSSLKCPN